VIVIYHFCVVVAADGQLHKAAAVYIEAKKHLNISYSMITVLEGSERDCLPLLENCRPAVEQACCFPCII